MSGGTLSGIMTVLAFLAFLGVTFWAFSPKRKADFDSAARLPLNDDPLTNDRPTDAARATEPVPPLHDKEVK